MRETIQRLKRRRERGFQPSAVVIYHPTSKFDEWKRALAIKAQYGWRTSIIIERDPAVHPSHEGKIGNTSIRRGTRFGG